MSSKDESVTPSNNNKYRKVNLFNNLLKQHQRSCIVRTFSVTQKDFPKLILFDELVRRKKTKFSHLILEAMDEFLRRHHIPEYQVELTKFIGKTKRICSSPSCNEIATFIDISARGEFPVCSACHERHEKVGLLKGWRKI